MNIIDDFAHKDDPDVTGMFLFFFLSFFLLLDLGEKKVVAVL